MLRIAVLIPCKNEEAAIANVVSEFRRNLPTADIYVYDNASTDNTITEAKKSGAIIKSVLRPGKGNVVRAMFREIDSDIYLLCDGDGTYPAETAPKLIEKLIANNADMIVGSRLDSYETSQSRKGHKLGNMLLTKLAKRFFHLDITDMLSGYRVFTRNFVKSTPLFSNGFEVETILSVHAYEVDAKVIETPVEYRQRIEGTESKLKSFEDGTKIIVTLCKLLFLIRPIIIFGWAAVLFFISSLIIGIPVIIEFMETSLVPKLPSAVLAASLVVLAGLSLSLGLILHSLATTRRELKKIAFIKN